MLLTDINTLLSGCFSIREVAQSHHSMEQELAHAVNASSKAMDVVYANSKSSGVRVTLVTLVQSVLLVSADVLMSPLSLSLCAGSELQRGASDGRECQSFTQ